MNSRSCVPDGSELVLTNPAKDAEHRLAALFVELNFTADHARTLRSSAPQTRTTATHLTR